MHEHELSDRRAGRSHEGNVMAIFIAVVLAVGVLSIVWTVMGVLGGALDQVDAALAVAQSVTP